MCDEDVQEEKKKLKGKNRNSVHGLPVYMGEN